MTFEGLVEREAWVFVYVFAPRADRRRHGLAGKPDRGALTGAASGAGKDGSRHSDGARLITPSRRRARRPDGQVERRPRCRPRWGVRTYAAAGSTAAASIHLINARQSNGENTSIITISPKAATRLVFARPRSSFITAQIAARPSVNTISPANNLNNASLQGAKNRPPNAKAVKRAARSIDTVPPEIDEVNVTLPSSINEALSICGQAILSILVNSSIDGSAALVTAAPSLAEESASGARPSEEVRGFGKASSSMRNCRLAPGFRAVSGKNRERA